MAKKAMILKQQKKQKYSTREYNRCKICSRELAYKGEIPGVRKASW